MRMPKWLRSRGSQTKSNPRTSKGVRGLRHQRLENRQLMAADPIHVGVVYIETDYLETDADVGNDSRGDRFILSFSGGAADTRLKELRIVTDKDGDGISVGDPIYDTESGGRGKDGFHDFQVVSVETTDGRAPNVQASVADGGQELVLSFDDFRAGDRIEFTLDVDEVLRNSPDLAVFNDRLDVITSGQEFQDSILRGLFEAPHFEDATTDAVFINEFGDPAQDFGLNLPPDESDDVDSRPNRSAAAVGSVVQQPKPIELSGTVWVDGDLDGQRETNEAVIPGVGLTLLRLDEGSGNYIDTGLRATTDANGRYEFDESLGLVPGTYRIVEDQPAGYFSVASVPGTVEGVTSGASDGLDILTSIEIPDGGTSAINYDFGEALPASIAGFVYVDANNDGVRDPGEIGISGVPIQLVPIATLQPTSPRNAITTPDGSYSFAGLVPGRYEVIQVRQPIQYEDGLDTAGTIRGTTVGQAINPGDEIVGINLGSGDDGVEYNFGETPFGSLEGFVYLAAPGQDCDGHFDGEDVPQAGVSVELLDDSGNRVAGTTTDSNGRYFFGDLPVGNYRVQSSTPAGLIEGSASVGLIDGVRVGLLQSDNLITRIDLPPGGDGVDYNFCVIQPVQLSGHVYHDANRDGRRNAGEQGISGTTVTLVDNTGATVANVLTDNDGRYEFSQLSPGTYTVVETQPTGYLDGQESIGTVSGVVTGRQIENDQITQITIAQGLAGINYDFGEYLPSSIEGRVHVDDDGDCLVDPEEELLSGVVIQLFDESGQLVAQTTTNSDGVYRFDGLEPGNYTVVELQPDGFFDGDARVGSEGGLRLSPNRLTQIDLGSGIQAVGYDFCERPPAEISGLVFVDRDGDCFFDTGEVGLGGVEIELLDASGNVVSRTTTDASGRYAFDGLAEGRYSIREIQPAGYLHGGQRAGSGGGDDSLADLIRNIDIEFGESLVRYDFCELEPASLQGQVFVDRDGDCVRDDDEDPIAGVLIELRDDSGVIVATTRTGADGTYRFDNLAAGDYTVFESQPEGYLQGSTVAPAPDAVVLGVDLIGVTLSSGQDLVGLDFCEQLPASVSGRVWADDNTNQSFDVGESPIPGTVVDLVDDQQNVIATTSTDESGVYEFTGITPGTYAVRQSQPEGYFHGGQVVGDLGGIVVANDWLGEIVLGSDQHGKFYDFPEILPGVISGFVFQDGGAILTDTAPEPETLRDLRDGQFTSDDVPIGNVTLELRNVLGLPVDGERMLGGVYGPGPIRVLSDASGYYEFTGLRPGTYHVYQVQPDEFIDSLDTPGTAGGLAINPADNLSSLDEIFVQTLTLDAGTDPGFDGILNIEVGPGSQSTLNNFSEIIIDQEEVLPPQNPTPDPVTVPQTPFANFETPAPVQTFVIQEPVRPLPLIEDEWMVSWHLSVINGGVIEFGDAPSANNTDFDGVEIRDVAFRAGQPLSGAKIGSGRWVIFDLDGKRKDWGDEVILGHADATPLTGDFDGDGFDEMAIFMGGRWYVDLNGSGAWDAGDLWLSLGTALDRPVVGDWDGDGKDDVGIFGRRWAYDEIRIRRDPGLPDPANYRRRFVESDETRMRREPVDDEGKRYMQRTDQGALRADEVDHVFQYGEQTDTPLSGDWNGDGIDQIAIYRSGQWLLDSDGDGRATRRDEVANFGSPGDFPVVGDFDGDGIDDLAVVRGNIWIIDTDGDRRLTGNDKVIRIEDPSMTPNDVPVAGDFDNDGRDEPAYYRKSG
ncbi:MAG: SdrD B-like domain-containing protein [Planctomycetota bacterium]